MRENTAAMEAAALSSLGSLSLSLSLSLSRGGHNSPLAATHSLSSLSLPFAHTHTQTPNGSPLCVSPPGSVFFPWVAAESECVGTANGRKGGNGGGGGRKREMGEGSGLETA